MLADIEKNVTHRRETDRRMWFSMWILLSFVTFGIAWVIMIYLLIKRRNEHFARQKKLETLVLNRFRQLNGKQQSKLTSSVPNGANSENPADSRNAIAMAVSTLMILPTFYTLRFLMNDLCKHEEHEAVFLGKVVSFAKGLELSMNLGSLTMTAKSVTLKQYLALTVGTLGLAGVYWLYRIFNDYNRHFKRQWGLEDELLRALKSVETRETI